MERDETAAMPGITKTPGKIILQKENPPHLPRDNKRQKPRPLTILFSILALIALIHFIAAAHTATHPAQTVNCTSLLRTTDYSHIVQFHPQDQEISGIQFINEITGATPSVLVQVTDKGPQQRLDVYVYGCNTQQSKTALTLLFKMQGLIQGSASMSQAHTLSISQLDTTLPQSEEVLMQPLQQNIYREYIWHNGMFIQTEFPGLYPVLSRSEAEALQDQANNGQNLPWSDPLITAEQMAKDIFHWPGHDPQDRVQDNNGSIAHVFLFQPELQMKVRVTLERLIQHGRQGLWFVTDAQTAGILLDKAALPLPADSPITLKGAMSQPAGQMSIQLFTHTLTPLHVLNNGAPGVQANGNFTGIIPYTTTIADQPGLLLIEDTPGAGSNQPGHLLLTHLILG
ncbi:hypothetical protein EPA93_44075 [Ktedonosporobacter rubrisoli]|uniref:Bacterial spore germination immunoglobulin-like domain-containing protein n=1 Tax=Ktedonosporobacter rubrisoli TaxID=2509675 RepID=A0A4P6K338_KTERU|nr:hypothetical protein [Ktedonosporobacter rubrisoli]QBD82579.1 hypothetical protein EPA93_44075 [Ktedonosporobacter rubrisoli]